MAEQYKTTIVIEKTDNGFTIDVKGKSLDDLCCGCIPIMAGVMKGGMVCCEPVKKDKE